MRTMTWHVQYREGGTDHLVRYPTPEEAIESACRLIDKGCDVYGMMPSREWLEFDWRSLRVSQPK
jgi:hypothetical protein